MFYRISYFIVWIIFFALFFFRREGEENIPKEGPVIIAANHVSYLDPVVVGMASPRPVCFMAKADLFKIPVLKQLITYLYAFPVHRGKYNKEALTKALGYTGKGQGCRNIS